MIDINEFYKHIWSEDIIYHYTKASTAIDYILYDKLLKLTPRKNSVDPIEIYPNYGIVCNSWSSNNSDWDKLDLKYATDINEVKENLQNRIERYVQVCFCKNKIQAKEFVSFFKQTENFGFTKPRMWDQYGDQYTGVCIAFSKRKLIKNNNDLNLIKEGQTDVNYLTYSKLVSKMNDISLNAIDNLGRNEYEEFLVNKIDEELCSKHEDYRDENEYKICTLFDKGKSICTKYKNHIDYYMFLNIENCVEAIFMSSYVNRNQKSSLLHYSEELKVPLLELKWKNNGIVVEDYKCNIEIMETVKNANKGYSFG